MRRISNITPGYNCGPGGKDCQHEKKGNHGIGSDNWYYAVTDDVRAVSLLVFSGDYPPSVERATLPEKLQKPWGAYLHFHVADSTNGTPCDLVTCGKCKSDVSALQAGEFWEEHHVGEQREQPESFWLALESRLPEPPREQVERRPYEAPTVETFALAPDLATPQPTRVAKLEAENRELKTQLDRQQAEVANAVRIALDAGNRSAELQRQLDAERDEAQQNAWERSEKE